MEENLGASEYAFCQQMLACFQYSLICSLLCKQDYGKGIPVACETDIYERKEYIITCATRNRQLLDINNTVPKDMYDENRNCLMAIN